MSFRFKQFYIEDSKCAMKVGTDGVLLGAWAETEDVRCQMSDVRGRIALLLDFCS